MATLLSDENNESFGLILNKKELAYLMQCVRRLNLVAPDIDDLPDPIWDVMLSLPDSTFESLFDLISDEWFNNGVYSTKTVILPSGWSWED